MSSIISKLPDHEKKALSLCGITQDSQLKNTDVQVVISDLRKAHRFFPEEASALSDARVMEIYAMVCGTRALYAPTEEELKAIEEEEKKEAEAAAAAAAAQAPPTRAFPPLAPKRHQHRSGHHHRADQTPEKDREAPGLSHSVRCVRPIATYIAALSMILFYAGVVGMLLIPAMLFTGYIEEDGIIPSFVICAVALIPYALHGAWVGCSVCNMKFFMLRHYNINRHAHKFPVLEWTTLPTALHIIFLLWYRCPACGTSLRLFRRHHH